MKHMITSFIIYIILLGSSFCLGFPQSTQNANNVYNKTHETTTAEPKTTASKSSSSQILSSSLSSIITSNKMEIINSTTPLYHENATTKSIYYSQIIESTTENLHHSTYTTAIPVTPSSSTSSNTRQFDILSFMGGSLFTFCLIAIGIVLWKAYKVQIERNYRTI